MMKYQQKSQKLIEISVELLNTMIHIEDSDCKMDTLMAFTNLIKIEEHNLILHQNKLDLIHTSAVVAKFIDLLQSTDIRTVSSTVNLIAHLTTSSHTQIEDFLIENKILEYLQAIFVNFPSNRNVMKEIFFIVSNLIVDVGHQTRVEKLIESGLFDTILDVLANSPFDQIWREATWALSNTIESSSIELRIQIEKKYTISKYIAMMLTTAQDNTKMQKIIIITLNKILDIDEYIIGESGPKATFQEFGGVDTLENLQTKPNLDIFSLSKDTLQRHYPAEDDMNDGGHNNDRINF